VTKKTIESARDYEREAGSKINSQLRPKFHMTPYIGWTNDPNGFSCYKGEYHLFYQYNPYSQYWDNMHWGHAVSKDLLHWEFRPCALAPDHPYDSFGCFSGSAIELQDGRQLIMYTGVQKDDVPDAKDIQVQCIAVGDGTDYVKYDQNPVLDATSIPEGLSPNDFRDPKIWQENDGTFRCVVGARKPEKEGSILLFSSPDGFTWKFESVLIANDGRFGLMWECPDFFELDGKRVLLCSPQEMMAKGLEYPNGYGTLCLVGNLDASGKKFVPEQDQTVDNGIDFYAPQTLLTPDGRRVMIGWMQNWATCDQSAYAERGWFGQMTTPRELSIRNGHLCQLPVREIEQYRSNRVEHTSVVVSEKTTLPGVRGRVADLEITLRPQDENLYHAWTMTLADNGTYHTEIRYWPHESVLEVDRSYSGSRKPFVHQKKCLVPQNGKPGELKLRILVDLYSVEVFVNDGEKAMTTLVTTDAAADGITFAADGSVIMDVAKYDLFDGE